jgi:hypothetical protein
MMRQKERNTHKNKPNQKQNKTTKVEMKIWQKTGGNNFLHFVSPASFFFFPVKNVPFRLLSHSTSVVDWDTS